MTTARPRGASPFGAFEWSVSRRYLQATRKGAGVSLISLIAFSGIALSVATLIVVMSVFQGFRIMLLEQLLSVNGHIYVAAYEETLPDYDATAERLSELPFVERATPVLRVDSYFISDRGQSAVQLNGVSPADLRKIEHIAGEGHIVRGSLDTFGEGRKGGNEILIGIGLANSLGVSAGDTLTVLTPGGAETAFGRTPFTQKAYRVGAIFSVGNSMFDTYYAYMPLEQAQLFARKPNGVSEIELRVADPLKIDPCLRQVADVAGGGAYVSDWRRRNSDIFNAVQTEAGLMRVLMLMIVLVATLLIISGLVMLVKDKRSDIAVMRTMGATQGTIARVFLMVGATIGVLGAFAGVALGALIVANLGLIERALSAAFGFEVFNADIYYLTEIPAIMEPVEIAVVVIFTLSMSFIFSAYPAWRASKVDPVEALRYE